jgi:hypothetical protein
MRTQRLFAYALAVCLVLLGTGSAIAADEGGDSNASLKGKFRLSLNKSCTDTATGQTLHIYFSGVTTYDGNGHATLTERGTLLFSNSQSVVTFEETATNLTYEVKSNGSFTQEGIFTATDNSYTYTGAKVVGQIDAQGTVLILSAAIPPVLETLSFSGGGSSERHCGASGTAVRIR